MQLTQSPPRSLQMASCSKNDAFRNCLPPPSVPLRRTHDNACGASAGRLEVRLLVVQD